MFRAGRRITTTLIAFSTAAAVLLPAMPAAAVRYPTGAPYKSIVAAFTKLQGSFATVLDVAETNDRNWARVTWDQPAPVNITVFHRTSHGWKATGVLTEPTNYVVMCATMPQREIRDLFLRPKLVCPKLKVSHPATAKVKAALVKAYKTAPSARISYYKGGHLVLPCLAGNDPTWAAAVVEFPDTGAGIWLHKVHGRWGVVTLSSGDSFTRPRKVPFVIALDLATCVHYAADIALQGSGAPPAID